jgi:glycosyltransferase involved in cell wall biosynthesis
MYNCARQIPRVLAQLTEDARALFSEIVIIDNRSTDGSAEAARLAVAGSWVTPTRILVNDQNYGLGGSHKVAFNYAIANGFDYCVVLHGDDQGSVADLTPLIISGAHRNADCLLGARFMRGARLLGYSAVRTLGNRAFNLLYSLVSGYPIYDLGAGLNLYAVKALRSQRYLGHANDLTFNYFMILDSISDRWTIRFFPIEWREDDQISNVKLVRQAWKVLKIAFGFAIHRRHFFEVDHSGAPGKTYSAAVTFDSYVAGESK